MAYQGKQNSTGTKPVNQESRTHRRRGRRPEMEACVKKSGCGECSPCQNNIRRAAKRY